MGYSTLRYLQRLQPRVVKVDRSFIFDGSTDCGRRTARLRSAHHDLFSAPKPIEDVSAMLGVT